MSNFIRNFLWQPHGSLLAPARPLPQTRSPQPRGHAHHRRRTPRRSRLGREERRHELRQPSRLNRSSVPRIRAAGCHEFVEDQNWGLAVQKHRAGVQKYLRRGGGRAGSIRKVQSFVIMSKYYWYTPMRHSSESEGKDRTMTCWRAA